MSSDSRIEVVGHRDYVAVQGDTFDMLALQAYGEERMAHVISRANPEYMPVLVFEGGERLRIPVVDKVETPETLPPWRR